MTKRKWNKAISLLLATIMVAGLAACGTQGQEQTSESKQSSNVSTESTVQKTEDFEISYPIDTDVELRWWATTALKYQSAFSSAEESPFHVGLSENTGVKINWEFPQDGVDTKQAFNLLLTDDELPEIISYWPTAAEAAEYIEDGMIWDLTDYLPTYAPDYWEYINSEENAGWRRAITTEDGRHYMVGCSRESDLNVTYMGPAVRKDWLDECNLEVPVTLEDWENMLRVFKDKYGAMYSGPNLGVGSNYGLASGTGSYTNDGAKWYVDNGEVKFANTTQEYKEYLETLNRWMEDGLLDPDYTTNDSSAIRNKCLNNEVGAMFIGSGTFRNILKDAEEAGSTAEWIPVQHPVTKAGESVTWMQTDAYLGLTIGAMVTKSCSEEELIIALQLLNYGYTDEGFMYWNFGNEGVSYTLDADGNPQWTELITESEVGTNTAYKYYIGMSSRGISKQASALIKLLNPGVAGDALVEWTANNDATKEHLMPNVSMTAEEELAYTDSWAAIQTFVNESVAGFINGDKSLDEWDEYVSTLEKIGLEDCRKLQQAAYERWLAK